MESIYNKVIKSKLLELKLEIKNIKLLSKTIPKFTKPICFESAHNGGISKAIGVYKIIYAPTGVVMSIGQGNIGARKDRHLQIFRNKGLSAIYKSSGASSGSQCGSKMYKFDSNIDNWLFSWCDCGNKNIAAELEIRLIDKYKPEFNLETMAGIS
jgi:hypothetical protein